MQVLVSSVSKFPEDFMSESGGAKFFPGNTLRPWYFRLPPFCPAGRVYVKRSTSLWQLSFGFDLIWI